MFRNDVVHYILILLDLRERQLQTYNITYTYTHICIHTHTYTHTHASDKGVEREDVSHCRLLESCCFEARHKIRDSKAQQSITDRRPPNVSYTDIG